MMVSNYNFSITPYDYVKSHTESIYHVETKSRQKITRQDNIEIRLDTKYISIPYAIKQLESVIEDARNILNLDNDWDGNEAVSYNAEIWEKALEFVVNMHLKAFKYFDVELDYPKIQPGPDGSIDIVWEETLKYEILANFSTDKENIVNFYGEDNTNGSFFKGSFKESSHCSSLLMILIGMKKCGK
jgi:hypothetical protein